MKILNSYAVMILTFAAILGGCSKKNDPKPSGTAHKIVVKAEVSSGSNLHSASYGTENTGTPVTGLSGTTWTSPEFTVPAGTAYVRGVAVGEGPNAAATIKVQVFVDGVMKKEATGSGTSLSAVVLCEL